MKIIELAHYKFSSFIVFDSKQNGFSFFSHSKGEHVHDHLCLTRPTIWYLFHQFLLSVCFHCAFSKQQQEVVSDSKWMEENATRRAKWWYSTFHTVTAMIGAGVLSLPYAMAYLGWYICIHKQHINIYTDIAQFSSINLNWV